MASWIEGCTAVVEQPRAHVSIRWGDDPPPAPWIVSYIDDSRKLVQSTFAGWVEAVRAGRVA